MLTSELEPHVEQDREFRLQRLRIEAFRRLGYGLRAALLLAVADDVDFALAERLRELRCPEETALQILL